MNHSLRRVVYALSTLLFCVTGIASMPARAVEQALIDGVEYRLIGPWRGGRVTAVSEDIHCVEGYLLQAGCDGPSVAAGEYTACIALGNVSATTSFTVANDPRSFFQGV